MQMYTLSHINLLQKQEIPLNGGTPAARRVFYSFRSSLLSSAKTSQRDPSKGDLMKDHFWPCTCLEALPFWNALSPRETASCLLERKKHIHA